MIFSRGRARRTLFACVLACASPAIAAPVETVEISARPISQFHIGQDDQD
ncbi:hypothetical protein RFM68_01360 [Mesorhizobium sp. MSK_1335]|uniref:Uncharacterized protein n=1 Tax=Mesorhizobium montanum TaxID=3072323 RepID=A0ABU4ZCS6_9HYPH|nr:hypothetical protein [Mesorhizobium sp. MSK_1335]MDX8523140.1 hypothetical protein [Mesorhizobium sp. MSK_1335]